jgi:hypothetical protein
MQHLFDLCLAPAVRSSSSSRILVALRVPSQFAPTTSFQPEYGWPLHDYISLVYSYRYALSDRDGWRASALMTHCRARHDGVFSAYASFLVLSG